MVDVAPSPKTKVTTHGLGFLLVLPWPVEYHAVDSLLITEEIYLH